MTVTMNLKRRIFPVASAFMRVAYLDAISYPLSLVMSFLSALVPLFVYYFIAPMIDSGPSVGYDYFTFVVIGLIGLNLMTSGLRGLTGELSRAIDQGRFEALLAEQVSWRMIPFGLSLWAIVSSTFTSALVILMSIPLGGSYRPVGLLIALPLIALGVIASLGVGVLSAAGKLLSKRSDPVVAVYLLAASLLSGVFFPLEQLPVWLRALSWTIPHTYVLGAIRSVAMPAGAEMGGPSGITAVIGLLGFIVIIYPIALSLYGRALMVGRRLGILGGY